MVARGELVELACQDCGGDSRLLLDFEEDGAGISAAGIFAMGLLDFIELKVSLMGMEIWPDWSRAKSSSRLGLQCFEARWGLRRWFACRSRRAGCGRATGG